MRFKNYNCNFLQFTIALFLLATPIESLPIAEGLSVVKLSAILVIIAWFITYRRMPSLGSAKVFMPMFCYAILSCVWSIDFSASVNSVLTFFLPSLFVAMIMDNSIEKKSDIVFYLFFYVIGCVISSIGGLATRQQALAEAVYAGQERLSSFGQDQNTLAYLLIMGSIPLFHFLMKGTGNLTKYMSSVLLVMLLFMILSTGSRTGAITFILVFIFFLITTKRIKILVIAGIAILLLFPILLSYIPEATIDRLFQTAELIEDGDFSERGNIWHSAFNAFGSENYILGVGYSNFSTMLMQHYGWQMASHNTYLTYLIEFGILGCSTFIYALVRMFKVARNVAKQENNYFVFCYIIPLFIYMFTLETEYKRWIFIIFVLLSSWERLNDKEINYT